MTTPYHAKYYAAELTKRCSSHQLGKLNQSIFNATVDLQAQDLERRRKDKRHALFDAQDEIDHRKEILIGEIEAKLKQNVKMEDIFIIRWRVV